MKTLNKFLSSMLCAVLLGSLIAMNITGCSTRSFRQAHPRGSRVEILESFATEWKEVTIHDYAMGLVIASPDSILNDSSTVYIIRPVRTREDGTNDYTGQVDMRKIERGTK